MPRLRADINVSVHQEDGEDFLVLYDPLGFADGPIMLHADMADILSVCDGQTTTEEISQGAGVAADSQEIIRVAMFVKELAKMGYVEGDEFDNIRAEKIIEWDELSIRPAVCSGQTYPDEPEELRYFLSTILGITPHPNADSEDLATKAVYPSTLLAPHIDFRVAPNVYAPAFHAIANHPADLVIAIGTSHYWSDHSFVLTDKDFETPLGVVKTNKKLVRQLTRVLPDCADTDIAHRPEHSLELHLVCLKHLWPNKDFEIVPLLVTAAALEGDVLQRAAQILEHEVGITGRRVLWLISGDLAHVGLKFGDSQPASEILPDAASADSNLLIHLEAADPEAYNHAIESSSRDFRVCGHAPTMLGLLAAKPSKGVTLAYEHWNEEETASAVTFASVAWH